MPTTHERELAAAEKNAANLGKDLSRKESQIAGLKKDLATANQRTDHYRSLCAELEEKKTAALIDQVLSSHGIRHHRLCGTGVVGLIRGEKPGPTILVRADKDGLPVLEENKVSYKSKIPGVMHA